MRIRGEGNDNKVAWFRIWAILYNYCDVLLKHCMRGGGEKVWLTDLGVVGIT